MGCNSSKEKKPEETKPQEAQKQEEQKPRQPVVDYEAKYKASQQDAAEKQAEIDKLQKELTARRGVAECSKNPHQDGNWVFQVVVSGEQATQIAQIEGVAFRPMQGAGAPLVPERENVILISCPEKKVSEVIAVCSSPFEVKKLPKPAADAPPPVFGEKPTAAATEGEDAETSQEGEKSQSKEEPASPKKPKVSVPDQVISAKTDINLGTWDGKVKMRFTWTNEPSTYSEYNDPSGSNWWSNTNVRKAPDDKPKEVVLQYRRGMGGVWTDVPCTVDDHGAWCEVLLPVEKVEPMQYRGFQSRWIIDGEKYLTPLQLAPTLQSKLMTYPTVRNAVKALPADKQSLENIPNEDLRKAVLAIENIIPMNTWDYTYGLTLIPGAKIDEQHVMTIPEQIEWIAKQKSNDPALVSEMRKAILKSPIMAANAAAGMVGIKLNVIIDNLDFFLPKFADPNFAALEKLEASQMDWEKLRREMQTDVNGIYPTYQQGIRVTFPPARVLRAALQAKRPEPERVALPFALSFDLEKDTDFLTKHSVQFVYWTDDYLNKQVVECEGEELTETFGTFTKETKTTWRKYKANVALQQGLYKYHWVYDGKNFFNNGCPFGEEYHPPSTYLQFTVDANVVFGIGVPM